MSIVGFRGALAALLVGLGAASLATSAQAQGLQWTAQDNTDEVGRRFGNLALSVPQTDDIAILATCRAQPSRQVEVQLFFIDAGNNPPGRAVNILFATDVMPIVGRPGQIAFNEFFGPHGVVMLGRNDDLWGRMRADQQLSISLDGQNYFTTSLRGSNAAITRFFAICDAVWGIAPPPPATPPPPTITPVPPTTTPPVTPPTPPPVPPTTTPPLTPPAPAASGAVTPKPADTTPPATNPPAVTPANPDKPATAEPTASGAVNADALYLGRWFQVEAGARCASCTLEITDLGPSLAMAAAAGWSANIIWGADGDTGYATGQGLWTSGALAMQGFTIDVTLVGLSAMDVHLVTTAGQALDFRFVR